MVLILLKNKDGEVNECLCVALIFIVRQIIILYNIHVNWTVDEFMNSLLKHPKMGVILSPKDPRDIPAGALLTTDITTVPEVFTTDISMIPVLNQKNHSACTGFAHYVVASYFEYRESGIVTPISPRFYYAMAKGRDNLVGPGTFPRIISDISRTLGGATEVTVPNAVDLTETGYIALETTETILDDAYPFRTKGYAYVDFNDPQAIMRAFTEFKLIEMTISAGKYKSSGRIYPSNDIKISPRFHRITAYGYKKVKDDVKIYFRNSWSEKWGDKGNGYFLLSDYLKVPGSLSEWCVYTDIPNEVREKYKAMWPYKYFQPNEVQNLKPELIAKLDLARGLAGIPFKITSGYRTKNHNKEVGGVEGSSHEKGEAVDILIKDSVSGGKILLALVQAGFKRFGFYKDGHLHCDISKDKPSPCYWIE